MKAPRQRITLVKRYPLSVLLDVAHCVAPMSSDLAETIRVLRKDHGIGYADLAFYLAESDPDYGLSVGLGKALSELSALYFAKSKK